MSYENVIRFYESNNEETLGIFETNLTEKEIKDLRDAYREENEEDYNWEDFVEYIDEYGEWRRDVTYEVSF